jgi:hypothetical protein
MRHKLRPLSAKLEGTIKKTVTMGGSQATQRQVSSCCEDLLLLLSAQLLVGQPD